MSLHIRKSSTGFTAYCFTTTLSIANNIKCHSVSVLFSYQGVVRMACSCVSTLQTHTMELLVWFTIMPINSESHCKRTYKIDGIPLPVRFGLPRPSGHPYINTYFEISKHKINMYFSNFFDPPGA